MNDRIPVRPSAVNFPDAPTHEPMMMAVLVTLDPDGNTGLHSYVRLADGIVGPDPEQLDMLVMNLAIRNLPEAAHDPHG